MTLTDVQGGYLVPFEWDPSVILTNDGRLDGIRKLARVVPVTTDEYHLVASDGVTTEWLAENAEVADHSPTLSQPSIKNHKQASFVPISIEALEAKANVSEEVAKLIVDEVADVDAQAICQWHWLRPTVRHRDQAGGFSEWVQRSGTELAADDFRAVQEHLRPRYQANAAWALALPMINRARSIVAGDGLTTPFLTDAGTLLGKRVEEASHLDSTITASSDDYVAVYGDFSNFALTERVGARVELVQHLFGPNQRPTGQRGWWMHRRVGADVVNSTACVC